MEKTTWSDHRLGLQNDANPRSRAKNSSLRAMTRNFVNDGDDDKNPPAP